MKLYSLLIFMGMYLNLLGPFMIYGSIQLDSQPAELLSNAEKIRYQNPDEAIELLNSYYADFLNAKDTSNAINALTLLATVHGNQAKYKDSYDKLWKALILADQANLETAKIYINIRIGRYYSFYKRKEQALKFFHISLDLHKSLVEKGQIPSASLADTYMAFTSTYRELDEPDLAQIYLDSCLLFHQDGISETDEEFLSIEQAVIHIANERYHKGIAIINENIPWFQENYPSYLVLIYSHIGDAYTGMGDMFVAEDYYKKALSIAEEYHSHLDFSILIHQKLSNHFSNQGEYAQALEELKKVQEFDKLFFDSRSENNRPLLEIPDEFRLELEHKEQELTEQRLIQLEQQNKVKFLQNTIISVSMVALILFGVLFFYYLRNKYRAEKQLIKKEQELEIQNSLKLLELKNRELATLALKIIEKDEFLQELKNKVSKKKTDISLQEVKHLINTATINNSDNWNEFEARFVAVNKEFYSNLMAKYPKLTQGDRKLCALIKLKFNSKEIARLMGISVESVHTTRYRLRKKLNVGTGIELTQFVDNI